MQKKRVSCTNLKHFYLREIFTVSGKQNPRLDVKCRTGFTCKNLEINYYEIINCALLLKTHW